MTYEIDGKVATIEDTVICEYDGIETLGENGKHRKWKEHLKSGKETLTLLTIDETSKIYFDYDDAEYYMDDLGSTWWTKKEYEEHRQKYPVVLQPPPSNDTKREFVPFVISTDEAWERYKLRILDAKYAKPITNSFK